MACGEPYARVGSLRRERSDGAARLFIFFIFWVSMISRFFLFYLITWITGSPFFALGVILALYIALDYQFTGLIRQGMALLKMESEIASLHREVTLNPHNVASLSDLGRLLVMRGRAEKALPYLKKAYERLADSAETNYYLGLAHLKTGESARGETEIVRALEINPRFRYGEPALHLAEHYSRQGRTEEARTRFEQFFSIHSSSPEGYYRFGGFELQCGHRAAAIEGFRKAIEVSHLSPPFKKRTERLWVMKARYALIKARWTASHRVPGMNP